jgi:hypothetical protein
MHHEANHDVKFEASVIVRVSVPHLLSVTHNLASPAPSLLPDHNVCK